MRAPGAGSPRWPAGPSGIGGMQTIALEKPAPLQPRSRSGSPVGVFTGATGVALVHALDDAFVRPPAGLGLSQHASPR